MTIRTIRAALSLSLAAFAITVVPALAQALPQPLPQQYPSRSIRMIVPFSPGGASDTAARILSAHLAPRLGQTIVIDNRPAAAGTIGVEIAARAAPDGYTLLMGSNAEIVVNPNLYPKLPYDTARDFHAISLVVNTPLLVVVHPSVEAKSIKDLIALAKARPDGLNYASSGNGGGVHLATEMFKSATGVKMRHIPFQGGAPGLTQTIAGDTQVMFVVMPLGLPQARAGRVRALAVTAAQRVSAAPEIPTVAESGVPGYELVIWNGLMAPSGVPQPILTRLYQETIRIIALPEVRESYAKRGAEATSSTSEAFAALIIAERRKYAKVIKDANIRID